MIPIPEAPPQINREGLQVISQQEAMRRLQARVKPPAPNLPPVVKIEKLDVAVCNEVNPLRLSGDIVTLYSAIDGATIVRLGDREVLKLTPMPAGTVPNSHLTLDELEAIAADPAIGHDDDGDGAEVSSEWVDQGRRAMAEVLAHAPPRRGIHLVQQTAEAVERMAQSVGRRYALPLSEIASALGHPVEARRVLHKPGGMAKALAMAAAKAAAQTERDAEDARARVEVVTAPNVATLAEHAGDGLLVDVNEPGFAWPPALVGRPIWSFGETAAVCWKKIPGLELPPDARVGYLATAPGSTVIPAIPAASIDRFIGAPSFDVFNLVTAIRRKCLPGLDRGPITRFGTEGIEPARAFLALWAHVLHMPRLGEQWWSAHIFACGVRGHLLTPPVWARMAFDAVAEVHARLAVPPKVAKDRKPAGSISQWSNYGNRDPDMALPMGVMIDDPDFKVPELPRSRLEEFADLAAAAAAGGEVEPGALMPKATESKKRR